mmetsp:Transcript_803/g.2727  ORF Transcript_803/g.2727 Transcript_803/m.2727 type:complete len:370 (-) Transcript_803:857-1966(-)
MDGADGWEGPSVGGLGDVEEEVQADREEPLRGRGEVGDDGHQRPQGGLQSLVGGFGVAFRGLLCDGDQKRDALVPEVRDALLRHVARLGVPHGRVDGLQRRREEVVVGVLVVGTSCFVFFVSAWWCCRPWRGRGPPPQRRTRSSQEAVVVVFEGREESLEAALFEEVREVAGVGEPLGAFVKGLGGRGAGPDGGAVGGAPSLGDEVRFRRVVRLDLVFRRGLELLLGRRPEEVHEGPGAVAVGGSDFYVRCGNLRLAYRVLQGGEGRRRRVAGLRVRRHRRRHEDLEAAGGLDALAGQNGAEAEVRQGHHREAPDPHHEAVFFSSRKGFAMALRGNEEGDADRRPVWQRGGVEEAPRAAVRRGEADDAP